MNTYYQDNRRAMLATLRGLIPNRDLTFDEALRLAELQANRLLERSDVTGGPVPEDVVLSLPRIERNYHQLRAASGVTDWNGRAWVIGINRTEPLTRQRFTLLHEFKHIIDYRSGNRLYRGDRLRSARRQAEFAADYFAGCVLVPKRLLRQAWYAGEQRIDALARHFDVSSKAIEVRLTQVGLRNDIAVEERPNFRPQLPPRPSQRYFRSAAVTTKLVYMEPSHA